MEQKDNKPKSMKKSKKRPSNMRRKKNKCIFVKLPIVCLQNICKYFNFKTINKFKLLCKDIKTTIEKYEIFQYYNPNIRIRDKMIPPLKNKKKNFRLDFIINYFIRRNLNDQVEILAKRGSYICWSDLEKNKINTRKERFYRLPLIVAFDSENLEAFKILINELLKKNSLKNALNEYSYVRTIKYKNGRYDKVHKKIEKGPKVKEYIKNIVEHSDNKKKLECLLYIYNLIKKN